MLLLESRNEISLPHNVRFTIPYIATHISYFYVHYSITVPKHIRIVLSRLYIAYSYTEPVFNVKSILTLKYKPCSIYIAIWSG